MEESERKLKTRTNPLNWRVKIEKMHYFHKNTPEKTGVNSIIYIFAV